MQRAAISAESSLSQGIKSLECEGNYKKLDWLEHAGSGGECYVMTWPWWEVNTD